MTTTKQDREFFIRHVSGIVKRATDSVIKDFGAIDTTEVSRRIARTLWTETDLKGHATIADWVKHVRVSTGKTQAQFAEALETTQVTVARWESGKSKPSRPYLKAIKKIGARHWIWEED